MCAFGALLRLYPRNFRAGYRHEMTVLFAQQLDDARATDGTVGVLRLWARSLADLVATAPAAHLQKDALVAAAIAAGHPTSWSDRASRFAWKWAVAALAPGVLAIATAMGQRGSIDAILAKPPEAVGLPLGLVILAASATWYTIGLGLIGAASHRAVRLVGVVVFVLPAALAFLMDPPAIFMLQNLYVTGSD